VLLHDPECPDDVCGPHRRKGTDRLGASAAGELDDRLPARFLHMDVRWCVLAGRQEDDDPKPGAAEDRGHSPKVTEQMGLR